MNPKAKQGGVMPRLYSKRNLRIRPMSLSMKWLGIDAVNVSIGGQSPALHILHALCQTLV